MMTAPAPVPAPTRSARRRDAADLCLEPSPDGTGEPTLDSTRRVKSVSTSNHRRSGDDDGDGARTTLIAVVARRRCCRGASLLPD
eukprot:795634-Prymnesium_polylepis.1